MGTLVALLLIVMAAFAVVFVMYFVMTEKEEDPSHFVRSPYPNNGAAESHAAESAADTASE